MSRHAGATDSSRTTGRAAVAMVLGYLVNVGTDEYEPTADPEDATHTHSLIGGEIVIVPLAEADGSVRTVRLGADTYVIHGV